jgi:hypothetical protein
LFGRRKWKEFEEEFLRLIISFPLHLHNISASPNSHQHHAFEGLDIMHRTYIFDYLSSAAFVISFNNRSYSIINHKDTFVRTQMHDLPTHHNSVQCPGTESYRSDTPTHPFVSHGNRSSRSNLFRAITTINST